MTLVRSQTRQKKLKVSATKDDKAEEKHTDELQPSQPPATPEVNLDMP